MSPTSPPTALIADDEDGPRAHLVAALRAAWPDWHLVEAANGIDAWDCYLEHSPRISFLDVRMPGMTGIEVAQRIAGHGHVVFVCSATDHALQTFQTVGIEHLIKPVDEGRVAELALRLLPKLAEPPADLADALDRLGGRVRKPAPLDIISGGAPDDLQVLAADDVLYFETEARLTKVVHTGGQMLIRTPIKELLGSLDATRFLQIHRSVIVNQGFVAGIDHADDGSLRVRLRDRPETLAVAPHFHSVFGDL